MRNTPLLGEYERHHGKVVDFHGWALPVQFDGIIEEHRHTRSHAGVYDCSHMGEFMVRGADAIQALDALVIGDLVHLAPGRCRYTALLNDSAGILDDCVALRLSRNELFLVTNAGPLEAVAAHLAARVPGVENRSEAYAKLDLQGPEAWNVLMDIGVDAAGPLHYWNGTRCLWKGEELIVTRGGYTGELGYELFVPPDFATTLWRALTQDPRVRPCGLGARDTLRTEMGYPLYGQDMDESTTPLEAGLGRFVAWDTEFPGKALLAQQRARGDYRVLTPVRALGRQAPRTNFEVRRDGQEVGRVTSGTFGPSVGVGMGLARLDLSALEPGTTLESGPRSLPIVTEAGPVYKHGTCRISVSLPGEED